MTEKVEIYEFVDGEIVVWKEPQDMIALKVLNKFHDPVELAEHEAQALGELLIRLAKE
jgi:hypothetical protein